MFGIYFNLFYWCSMFMNFHSWLYKMQSLVSLAVRYRGATQVFEMRGGLNEGDVRKLLGTGRWKKGHYTGISGKEQWRTVGPEIGLSYHSTSKGKGKVSPSQAYVAWRGPGG